MSWDKLKLGEFCTLNYGRNLPSSKRQKGSVPVFSSAGQIDFHTSAYVESQGIIIGRKGSVGKIYFSDKPFFPIDTTYYIIPNENYNLKFLFYNIQTLGLENLNSDAAVPGLNRETAYSQLISIPPLQTQKRIADILSAYDDLIENNLKRIKLLEQAAQNIYKEWFVNLHFPGHENTPINEETGLPEGWEEVRMEYFYSKYIGGGWGKENLQKGYNNKAHVIRGTDFNKIKSGSFDSTPLRFHKESNLSSRKLENGDLILEVSNGNLSKVGDILLITDDVLKVLDTDIICASFCKMLRPKTLDKSLFIYHYITEMNTSNMMLQYKNESAAGINNFNFTSFLSKEIVELPSQQLLSGFYNIVNPIHEQISNLRQQIQKLKTARDILLPRLMNRTIEV